MLKKLNKLVIKLFGSSLGKVAFPIWRILRLYVKLMKCFTVDDFLCLRQNVF